jgi:smad nuclear-interacting protein 1
MSRAQGEHRDRDRDRNQDRGNTGRDRHRHRDKDRDWDTNERQGSYSEKKKVSRFDERFSDGRSPRRRSRSRSRSRSPPHRSHRASDDRRGWDREQEQPPMDNDKSDLYSQDNLRTHHDQDKHSRKRERNEESGRGVWNAPAKEQWGNVGKEAEIDQLKNPAVPEEEKAKANFGLTGALAKDIETGNMKKGQVLKFTEPLDAALPTKQWRFYVFKGDEVIETLYIHRQSVYLIGRDDRIADIITLHESCSKQHAVVQFREMQRLDSRKSSDESQAEVRPYLMDLGSANKTFLNGKEIEEARYYELREKDVIRFGASSREYVLLHSSSAT